MSLASTSGSYPHYREFLPETDVTAGKFRLRFARNPHELDAILRLRFEVFNVELHEGLESSFATGRDEDEFDTVCHHLMVTDTATDKVVGTYRMQTFEMAGSW